MSLSTETQDVLKVLLVKVQTMQPITREQISADINALLCGVEPATLLGDAQEHRLAELGQQECVTGVQTTQQFQGKGEMR